MGWRFRYSRLPWSCLGNTWSRTKSPRGGHDFCLTTTLPLLWPWGYVTWILLCWILSLCSAIQSEETRENQFFSLWLWSRHFDWRKKTLHIKFLQYCLVCLTDSITRCGQQSSAVSSVSNLFHSFKVASESTRLMDTPRKPSQDGLILNSTCLLIIFATSFVCVEPRSLLIDSSLLVTRGIFLVALIFHSSSSNTGIPRYPLSFKGMQVQMSAKNPVMSDFPASNSSEIMASRGVTSNAQCMPG